MAARPNPERTQPERQTALGRLDDIALNLVGGASDDSVRAERHLHAGSLRAYVWKRRSNLPTIRRSGSGRLGVTERILGP